MSPILLLHRRQKPVITIARLLTFQGYHFQTYDYVAFTAQLHQTKASEIPVRHTSQASGGPTNRHKPMHDTCCEVLVRPRQTMLLRIIMPQRPYRRLAKCSFRASLPMDTEHVRLQERTKHSVNAAMICLSRSKPPKISMLIPLHGGLADRATTCLQVNTSDCANRSELL